MDQMDFHIFLIEKLVDIGRATLERHAAISTKNELASRDLAIPFLSMNMREKHMSTRKN